MAVERGHSRNTLTAYRRDLSRYLSWLEDTGFTRLDMVTAAKLGAFYAHLSSGDDDHRPLATSSVSRVASVVRGLHTFAVEEGHCLTNPAAELAAPRPAMRLPKAIAVDDVERLLDAARVAEPLIALRDSALLEFLYGTGARVTETIECCVDDVDSAAVTLRGKGGKTRVVPLGGYAQRAVHAYSVRSRPSWTPSHPRLFVNSRGAPLTRQGVFHVIKTVADRAGLSGDIGPHTLRHSFATHLLDGGADIRVVQELLGHSAVSTTQIYTLVTVDKLREVYATSHPRARLSAVIPVWPGAVASRPARKWRTVAHAAEDVEATNAGATPGGRSL